MDFYYFSDGYFVPKNTVIVFTEPKEITLRVVLDDSTEAAGLPNYFTKLPDNFTYVIHNLSEKAYAKIDTVKDLLYSNPNKKFTLEAESSTKLFDLNTIPDNSFEGCTAFEFIAINGSGSHK